MNLQYIKEEKCPICGCNIVAEENKEIDTRAGKFKYREHAHGGHWEHRKFACGQRISYSPNSSRTEVDTRYICTQNKQYEEREEKRKIFREKVKEFIDSYEDIDDEYKARIKQSLPSY